MKNEKLYVLIDPITLKVRYIGITNQNLKDRLNGHISSAKNRQSDNWHKTNWINKILSFHQKPIIRLLKTFKRREDAEKLEETLINKYKEKRNLVNIALDSAKFDSTSAGKILSKTVYVYDYQGNYIECFSSIKSCSEELSIYYSTIKKCLNGEYKYAKKYQFSFEKVDKMSDLTEYSTGNSKEVIILDTYTDEILRFKSKVDCCKQLNLNIKSTEHKRLLASLNKEFGNRYQLLLNNTWQCSTYYNTGVIIKHQNKIYTYLSKKELLESLGYQKSVTIDKFNEILDKHFYNFSSLEMDLPQCEVIRIRKSRELLECP